MFSGASTHADARTRPVVGDSVWCGGSACLLLLLVDAAAVVKGGRDAVPAGIITAAVAGLLLPVLNVYFVARDLFAGRRRQAALGLLLSLAALLMAVAPPWSRWVRPPT